MSTQIPEPRDAATVMLVRDGAAGVEVFLQHRSQGMAFAGGATVFPGGGVKPSDSAADVPWAGPSPERWAARLGTTPVHARTLVQAGVRETFEECGALLAGPTADCVVADTFPFAAERRAVEAGESTFVEFLVGEQLVLRSDLLTPWSRWITPVGERRRYDTLFFVAALPDGQDADGTTSEARTVEWRTPAEALDRWRAGESLLLPPTWSQLTALAAFDSVAAILAASPDIRPILPILHIDEMRVEFPGQEAYYAHGEIPWERITR